MARASRIVRHVPLVLVLCMGAVSVAAAAASRNLDLGLSGLYRLESVTVVYPAQPADLRETARRSAETRAEFLRVVHGMDVDVVRDDRASGPVLARDLLLLGWTNALLGTDRAPRPFRGDRRGLTVGDIPAFDAGTDFGFTAASPFNASRQWFFWSRIDPEVDRLQLLPSVGSQWAAYDRFAVLAQGMWKSDTTWPLEHNPDASRDQRAERDRAKRKLGRVRRGAYDLVFDPATVPSDRIDEIAKARTAALAEATKRLGAELPDDFRIVLHLYPDGETKAEATGIRSAIHSMPREGELHAIVDAAARPDPHEEYHLIARRTIGPCYSTAMFEGLTVLAEEGWRGRDLPFVAGRMLDRGSLPTVAELLSEGHIRALDDDGAFAGAGLLARWIVDRGGRDTLDHLYREPGLDVAAAGAALDLPADEVGAAFRSWATSFARAADDDVAAARLLDEAAARYRDGDYAGVADKLREVLEIRPGELQTLFNLAAAELRIGKYESAARHLREVLAAGLPEDDPLRVFSHYQLGRVYDVQGRRDEAVEQYRKVLELPDVRDSHRSAQDALAAPYTPERLE